MAEHIRFGAPDYWGQLQEWLGKEDAAERPRLAEMLESEDEREFYSAAFELFLTHFLTEGGWPFERHPELAWTGRHPDYLVHHPGGDFLLEAAVVLDSDEARAQERTRNRLREDVDSVVGPFAAIMTVDGVIPGDYRTRDVSEWLTAQIADLALQPEENVDLRFEGDGFMIKFTVFADEGVEGPVIAIENFTGFRANDVTTHLAIADSLDNKASRYGRPPIPYVVAIDIQTAFPIEAFSLTRSLYGSVQWQFSTPPQGPMVFRGETHARDGMLSAHDGTGRPIRTRISAVAVHKRTHRRDEETLHEMVICHHPAAAVSLSPEIFRSVPQLLLDRADDEGVTLRWADDPAPPRWARRS